MYELIFTIKLLYIEEMVYLHLFDVLLLELFYFDGNENLDI